MVYWWLLVVDLGRNISSNGTMMSAAESVDAVVEMVIVCDKEFGDIFGHNNQKILEYLTVYMWDVNMRYKTLPSVNLSFRITGIVVISVSPSRLILCKDNVLQLVRLLLEHCRSAVY